MVKHRKNDELAVWRFRREVTLGTVLHLSALLIMLIAGWSNLQKDLALIRHDLTRLIDSSDKLGQRMETVAQQCRDHEYRLKMLENEPARSPAAAAPQAKKPPTRSI